MQPARGRSEYVASAVPAVGRYVGRERPIGASACRWRANRSQAEAGFADAACVRCEAAGRGAIAATFGTRVLAPALSQVYNARSQIFIAARGGRRNGAGGCVARVMHPRKQAATTAFFIPI
jgi:hypothetical protein